MFFPLYLYPEKENLDKTEKRRPNSNNEMVQTIARKTGLQWIYKSKLMWYKELGAEDRKLIVVSG